MIHKVCEPEIRARFGTAAHFFEVVVFKSRVPLIAQPLPSEGRMERERESERERERERERARARERESERESQRARRIEVRLKLRTTTSKKCAAVPRRARI